MWPFLLQFQQIKLLMSRLLLFLLLTASCWLNETLVLLLTFSFLCVICNYLIDTILLLMQKDIHWLPLSSYYVILQLACQIYPYLLYLIVQTLNLFIFVSFSLFPLLLMISQEYFHFLIIFYCNLLLPNLECIAHLHCYVTSYLFYKIN